MAVICPTVTPTNLHEFQQQLNQAVDLAPRIHLDLMDGEFTPSKSPTLDDMWKPAGVAVDLHLMYKLPAEQLQAMVRLKPRLVIIHAESNGDFQEISTKLREADIKVGLALLQATPVDRIEPALNSIDHVLIFSGNLGYFGGTADLTLLNKVKAVKQINPQLEVGWDGGINDQNIGQLIEGGVDVLNVGGYLQKAGNPAHAYATLKGVASLIKAHE
jgi:ribulose-phosphate 3-epimerase